MGRREFYEEQKLKKLVYIFSIVLVISIVIFISLFTSYNRRLRKQSSDAITELGKMNNIVSNDDFALTSFTSDSNIAAVTNMTNNTNQTTIQKNSNTTKDENKKTINKTPVEAVVENTAQNNNTITENTVSNNNVINESVQNSVEENKELNFTAPVSGEIIKDFALDTLVYSNTLKEWTTHTGIDIKADKTSIVVASEDGTIESIKNDPRFGLTITILHDDGFKTIYSNLLTTEFVKEGEMVEKGQTIATIGETASFEVSDESHLHFEMYKDNEIVNPTIYLKDM